MVLTARILLVLVLNGLELYLFIPCVPMYACHGETFTFIFMSDMTLYIAEHAALLLGIIH